jgi:long-chain acyl-CoA synthetase
LIHALRAAGLKAGDAFSIMSGNRRENFEAIAAGTQGGWRFVPVNWHWVAEELAYVLENSDSKALIVDGRFTDVAVEALKRPECPELNAAIVIDGKTPKGFVDYEAFIAGVTDDEPADQSLGGPMFYTSGTTGRPKGVVGGAAGTAGASLDIMKFIGESITGTLSLPKGGTTLLEGPVYHSAQWAFSFLPLLGGSSVVMRHKFDAKETLELIDKYDVTNIHLVPTQFIRLLRLDDVTRQRYNRKSLKTVWHGAAPCPQDIKRQMIDWWGPIVNEYYGATEGSIISTISSEEWLSKPGSLGKPLPIMEVFVIGEEGERCGPNHAGQLYFKNQMGSDFEYHKDPEKTASAHLEPGVFTFGDVGYLDDEGSLFMSDRKIDMIISGGVNIYPAEIEGVLSAHPAVADAAVFGVPNDEFGEEVKAAVELIEGGEGSEELAEDLMDYCRSRLAGYKAPRSIDFEAALPRYPTGKLYKRLLRDAYWKDRSTKI